jgi:Flp pilus assembly protein TadG
MLVRRRSRDGIAAVEFAFVLPVLFTLMLGVWEVGRVIQVQQVLVNAAREGARIAAQGQTINLTGAYTQIHTTTGSPNVQTTVLNYLAGAGFSNNSGVTVTFAFLDGDTSETDPYQGTKDQRFAVDVTMPYDNVRLTNLNLLNFSNLTAHVEWVSMADDPFTINTTIPTWSPLP